MGKKFMKKPMSAGPVAKGKPSSSKRLPPPVANRPTKAGAAVKGGAKKKTGFKSVDALSGSSDDEARLPKTAAGGGSGDSDDDSYSDIGSDEIDEMLGVGGGSSSDDEDSEEGGSDEYGESDSEEENVVDGATKQKQQPKTNGKALPSSALTINKNTATTKAKAVKEDSDSEDDNSYDAEEDRDDFSDSSAVVYDAESDGGDDGASDASPVPMEAQSPDLIDEMVRACGRIGKIEKAVESRKRKREKDDGDNAPAKSKKSADGVSEKKSKTTSSAAAAVEGGNKSQKSKKKNADATKKAKETATSANTNVVKPQNGREAPERKVFNDPIAADPVFLAEQKRLIEQRWRCTVYVRNVPARISYAMLMEVCPDFVACRVPWHLTLRRSRGVAFLEFADEATAAKWHDILNERQLLDNQLTSSLGSPEKDAGGYETSILILNGLHHSTTREEIMAVFTKAQAVDFFQERRRTLDKLMPSVAFVKYERDANALEAFVRLQGVEIHGRKISVTFKRRSSKAEDGKDWTCLNVLGVKQSVSESDVLALFPRAKEIQLRTRSGIAVVRYETEGLAAQDFRNWHANRDTMLLDKRRLVVTFSRMRRQQPATAATVAGGANTGAGVKVTKAAPAAKAETEAKGTVNRLELFVKGMPKSTVDEDVKTLFHEAKTVVVPRNQNRAKGMAFLTFATEKAAAKAMAKYQAANGGQGPKLHGKPLQVRYSFRQADKAGAAATAASAAAAAASSPSPTATAKTPAVQPRVNGSSGRKPGQGVDLGADAARRAKAAAKKARRKANVAAREGTAKAGEAGEVAMETDDVGGSAAKVAAKGAAARANVDGLDGQHLVPAKKKKSKKPLA